MFTNTEHTESTEREYDSPSSFEVFSELWFFIWEVHSLFFEEEKSSMLSLGCVQRKQANGLQIQQPGAQPQVRGDICMRAESPADCFSRRGDYFMPQSIGHSIMHLVFSTKDRTRIEYNEGYAWD